MEKQCIACRGKLELGAIRAANTSPPSEARELGMEVRRFAFVRPGVPISANPIKAFVQGMREEPDDLYMPLQAFRCTTCGRVELFAVET